jgi:hypothetical protein
MMASRDVVVEGAPSLSLSREAGDGWGGGRS